MSSWHSPGKIYTVGHRAVRDLFDHQVQVQEKVDGSFFAFGLFEDEQGNPELRVRSKGAVMVPNAPEGMFKSAVETVKSIQSQLTPGWTYRGEVLAKTRHNALNYDRVPKGNIILFDIATDEETYLPYEDLQREASRLGLEVVPQLYVGKIGTAEELRKFLDTTSILGGQKIEGVVCKPLTPLFGQDGKFLMAKFVSEQFKEVQRRHWRNDNPTKGDILQQISAQYATPARWRKSVIHGREQGRVVGEPKDIGYLIRAIQQDILEECEQEMKDQLWDWAKGHILRQVVSGFAEFYKAELLRDQFEEEVYKHQDPTGTP